MSKFYVSPSPHLRSHASTRRIMLDVIIALVPAIIATFFSTAAGVLFSVVARKMQRK